MNNRPDPAGVVSACVNDAEMLRRALAWCIKHRKKSRPAWAAASEIFAMGSTSSAQLCRRFGFDPDTGKDLWKEPQE